MKVDAVVLAGAENNGDLKDVSSERYEALIPINGKPMIQYVVEALKSSNAIEQIVVVGPPELAKFVDSSVHLVQSGSGLAENVKKGFGELKHDGMALLVTSDIPYLHKEAVEDFLDRCSQLSGELYYPVVSQEANEKLCPGSVRTYVNLREGKFTGGNIILVSPNVVSRSDKIIGKVVSMRKRPWKLFSLLGLLFIVKFLTKKLRLSEIEQRARKLFDIDGVAIISPYPEIGIDVDKRSDWEMAEAFFTGSKGSKEA